MKSGLTIFTIVFCICVTQSQAQTILQDTLPDNHLLYVLHIVDNKLEGENEYLQGFRISMDIPEDIMISGLDSAKLMSAILTGNITGILTYPNGKTTEIEYEIVNHRGKDDIYMKTTLGYFLWESFEIHDDKLFFVIDWWYSPPARDVDLQTLHMAESLLTDSANWRRDDDRKCEDDIETGRWSLFCALKHSSVEKMGEYNHHNTAMQAARTAIDETVPDHAFDHPLMDFNNAPTTTYEDIIRVLAAAKKKIRRQLNSAEE